MKLFVQSYGCQMNIADSYEMVRALMDHGVTCVDNKEKADIVLLNTCTVRQHAEDRALSYIGRLKAWKRGHKQRKIIVAGCAAERLKKSLKRRFPHIDLVTGAKSIEEFPKLIEELKGTKKHPPLTPPPPRRIFDIKGGEQYVEGRESKVKGKKKNVHQSYDWFDESESGFGEGDLRPSGEPLILGDQKDTAFVTIMRGCNYTCSYCIVPAVRGREIYRSCIGLYLRD